MRFGVATIPAQPFEALCDLVRFAEGLGFTRVWIPDQSIFKGPFPTPRALAQRVNLMPAPGAGGSHGLAAFDQRKNLERFAAEVAPHL